MKKGRYEKERIGKASVWLIILSAISVASIVLVALLFINSLVNSEQADKDEISHIAPTDSFTIESNELSPQQTDAQEDTAQHEQTIHQEQASKPDEEMQETQIEATSPTIELVQRVDAEYEKWLSAAMIIGVSMEYPDFELIGVYAASSTSLEDKMLSDGVYIAFVSAGKQVILHSKAMEDEREIPGTMDISSEAIGYASFDKVDSTSVDLSSLNELDFNDLNELISQSMMVTIYSR